MIEKQETKDTIKSKLAPLKNINYIQQGMQQTYLTIEEQIINKEISIDYSEYK